MLPSSTSPTKTPPLDWVRQAGKVDLVLEDIATKLGRRRKRHIRTGGAALGLILLTGIAFWAVPYARETGSVGTPAAHRQSLALADGSMAELNAGTELHTDFRYGRRTIRMDRGEAFFSVAKDPAHPFLVETQSGVVRVTGTKFNVRLVAAGQVEVTLLEGSVGLQADGLPPLSLRPGQQFDPAKAGVRDLSPAEIAGVTAWRDGRLVLDGLTLAQAVARMAAYQGKKIDVAPEVASSMMGGSCSLDDLSGFLDFLPHAMSVQVILGTDGSYRIVAR